MDNGRFDITSDKNLDSALVIAFGYAAGGTASHWKEEDGKLLLAWTDPGAGWNKFVVPVNALTAKDTVIEWLKAQKYVDNDKYFDGSTGKGWRVYNEAWGHVNGDYK